MRRLTFVKCPKCNGINILVLDSYNYRCNDCGHIGKKLRFPSASIIVQDEEEIKKCEHDWKYNPKLYEYKCSKCGERRNRF